MFKFRRYAYVCVGFVFLLVASCKLGNSSGLKNDSTNSYEKANKAFNKEYHGFRLTDFGIVLKGQNGEELIDDRKVNVALFRGVNSCASCNFDAEDILLGLSIKFPDLQLVEVFFIQNQYAFDRLNSRISIPKIGIVPYAQHAKLQSKPFFAIFNSNGQVTKLFLSILPGDLMLSILVNELVDDHGKIKAKPGKRI